MNRYRFLALGFILMFLACTGIFPVSAHAELIRSVPDANASLAQSPPQVELFFSEAVDPKLSKLNVLDLDGNVVDERHAQVDASDGTHMTTTLPPIKDGVYTVVWTAFSADDGHETTGSFPFAVGIEYSNSNINPQGSENNTSIPLADAFIKGILYLVAAILVGGSLFSFFVWNPSRLKANILPEDLPQFEQLSRKMNLAALVVLVIADTLVLLLQTGHAEGSIIGLPWQPSFITVLVDTRIGVLGIARMAFAISMAGLLLPRSTQWNRRAALAVSLVFLLTFSLQSHAVAEHRPFVPVLADWMHLAAVSIWVGGLFSFLGGMWIVRRLMPGLRTSFTSVLIPQFTRLAISSVVILTITGIYSAILRVGAFNSLLTSSYGQALLIKLELASPLVFLGAVNFLIISPGLHRAAARIGVSLVWVARFLKLLTAEVVFGIVILIWVGIFTTLPPPRVTSTPIGFYQETRVNDLTIALNVDPNQIGINTYNVILTSGGQPVANAQNVSVEFNPLSGMIPASSATLARLGNGTYSLKGGYFGMPDHWDVRVVVERAGKLDTYADFKVDNTAPTGQPIPWRTLAVSLLIITALCYAITFRVLDTNLIRWALLGLIPAGVFVLLCVFLFIT
jgi:copper transport protein